MFKLTRVLVLVAGLVAALAAAVGSAGATTWTNSGSTAFTATSGASTVSGVSSSLTCTGATMAGTAPASEGGPNYTMTTTVVSVGCRLAGIATAATCTKITTLMPPVMGGVTQYTSVVSCSVTQGGREVCRLSGAVSGNVTNAATGAPGVDTANPSTSVSTANGSAGTCPLGVGRASLTGSGSGRTWVFRASGGRGGSGVIGIVLSQP